MRHGPLRVHITGDVGRGKTTVATIIEDALIRAGIQPDHVTLEALDPVTGQSYPAYRGLGEGARESRQTLVRNLPRGARLRSMSVSITTLTVADDRNSP